MSNWICKYIDEFNLNNYENKEDIEDNDVIYVYKDDVQNGTFIVDKKYDYSANTATEDITFQSFNSDLPYELIYKCKNNKFLYRLVEKEENFILNIQSNNQNTALSEDIFINFLKSFEVPTTSISPYGVNDNITFIIGQPNTGKSYKFEKSFLFPDVSENKYKYKKIPVSGGIGNEYKGLQNTDLAITYDPIKKSIKFGEFLQVLMSAIVNPKIPHIVFLDDFHNQDISSLLSEYTPLFKAQQKREINQINSTHNIFNDTFDNTDKFIECWNLFIENNCSDIPQVPLTNRISGNSIKLVYPNNFYLLGAANFNENSLNIFADWEDRAKIIYKDPLATFDKDTSSQFVQFCKKLNEQLKELLKENKIFDFEKYCFGLWKIVNKDGIIIGEEGNQIDIDKQKEVVKFFFGMIKNSLKYNNKNSEVNRLGWELMCRIKDEEWIKNNMADIAEINADNKNFELLHKYNIYEDDI